MKKRTFGEIFRFALVGGTATLLHYGIYYTLLDDIWSTLAYATGYILSFVFNFFATTYFTFHTTPSWKRFIGMIGAHGVNFLIHLCLFQLFLWLVIPKIWIPFPVYTVAVPLNFLLIRYIFTRHTPRQA